MPSPLGDKIRALRKQNKLSLEQLAKLTDSSKSYIWELENKDPKPSADKIRKIAAVLDVTTEFLLTESAATPDEQVLDEAFFHKYKTMSESDKKKIRKILDAWEDLHRLPDLLDATNDFRPIFWLVEKYLDDADAKRKRAVDQVLTQVPALMQAIKALQA